ncbi:hypothetical protein INR49_020450 [Caranx melampygus]|nr:hypothetical protein INR49_020450 [Caranx melampygus]
MATRTRERSSLWSRLSRRKRWFWFCEDEPPSTLSSTVASSGTSSIQIEGPFPNDGTVQAEGQSSRSRTRIWSWSGHTTLTEPWASRCCPSGLRPVRLMSGPPLESQLELGPQLGRLNQLSPSVPLDSDWSQHQNRRPPGSPHLVTCSSHP